MIRRATLEDTTKIAELLKPTYSQKKPLRHIRNLWSHLISEPETTLYVCDIDSDLFGILYARTETVSKQLRIVNLFVAAARKETDIEDRLLRAVLTDSDRDGIPALLCTSQNNKNAIAHYKLLGFVSQTESESGLRRGMLSMVRAPQPLNNHP